MKGGFIDPNAYHDTRGNSEVTFNMLALFDSPFEYFGFVNFTGTENNSDLGTYYTEHTVRWKFSAPFHLAAQVVFRNGSKNDSYRLGLRWVANQTSGLKNIMNKLHFNYAVTIFVFDANFGDQYFLTQIEHAYRFSFLKNKLYISGFADQNINLESDDFFVWVTEHQFGIQLLPCFYAVAEFRINEFRNETTGVGLGLEYVIMF